MSKRESSVNLDTRLKRLKEPFAGWDEAIIDAKKTIGEFEGRIARLRKAITVFTSLRDRGEPFPAGEVLGQGSDL